MSHTRTGVLKTSGLGWSKPTDSGEQKGGLLFSALTLTPGAGQQVGHFPYPVRQAHPLVLTESSDDSLLLSQVHKHLQ